MNFLIILNHPYNQSFCSAIAKKFIEGIETSNKHNYNFIYLDKDEFNPVMSAEELKNYVSGQITDPKVRKYQEAILEADHIVFIFPIWWEAMPALTKGFLDKVLTKGFAYSSNPQKPFSLVNNLTNIKGITLITTMNTPKSIYRFIFGNAIQRIMLRGTFRKIGIKNLKWINFSMVKFSSVYKREKWLNSIYNYSNTIGK